MIGIKITNSTCRKIFISQQIWKRFCRTNRMNCGSSNEINHIKIDQWKAIHCYCEHIAFPRGFPCFPADIIMTSRKHLLLCFTHVVPDHQTDAIQFNGGSPYLLRVRQSNVQNMKISGGKICSVNGGSSLQIWPTHLYHNIRHNTIFPFRELIQHIISLKDKSFFIAVYGYITSIQ